MPPANAVKARVSNLRYTVVRSPSASGNSVSDSHNSALQASNPGENIGSKEFSPDKHCRGQPVAGGLDYLRLVLFYRSDIAFSSVACMLAILRLNSAMSKPSATHVEKSS